MIWIVDNGKTYSDHVIRFVETPESFDMERYLSTVRDKHLHEDGYDSFHYFVIGKAAVVEWLSCRAMRLEEFQDNYWVEGELDCNGIEKENLQDYMS